MGYHDLGCDWKSGYVMNPSKKQRVGYIVAFEGLDMGEFLKPDTDVFTPYNNTDASYKEVKIDKEKGVVNCVGMIDSFFWGGGVGDPICIGCYISAENAQVIKAKMKTTLKTTIVKKFAYWICNFDEETKVWFEEAYPKDPTIIGAQLNAVGGKDLKLEVSDEPTKVAQNIDLNVYHMYFELVPAANAPYALHFATSGKTQFVRNWGLKVGTLAAAAMGG